MTQILSFAAYAPNSYLASLGWIDGTILAPWTCDREQAYRMMAPLPDLSEVLAMYPLAELVEA